jgi:hypothetical protein
MVLNEAVETDLQWHNSSKNKNKREVEVELEGEGEGEQFGSGFRL